MLRDTSRCAQACWALSAAFDATAASVFPCLREVVHAAYHCGHQAALDIVHMSQQLVLRTPPEPRNPWQVDDGRWSAPLFFRVTGIAEGFPAGGGGVDSALMFTTEEVADIWLKDQARGSLGRDRTVSLHVRALRWLGLSW